MEKVNYRPLVYICSPYAGDIEKNTENARRYSRFAADRNGIPIAPHLLFPQFMDEETERETDDPVELFSWEDLCRENLNVPVPIPDVPDSPRDGTARNISG